ncbi:hypothetical protein [Bradyrhizobium rifense]|uniref:hypothetical protein n=1 Tax=Bradyrhizobium rifense TaxID=515499 RepID=UPI001652F802|nr:hypothetical protein [Bradyrhizobium rifense]
MNLKAELEIRHLYGELDHLVSEKICDGWPKDSKPKSSDAAVQDVRFGYIDACAAGSWSAKDHAANADGIDAIEINAAALNVSDVSISAGDRASSQITLPRRRNKPGAVNAPMSNLYSLS